MEAQQSLRQLAVVHAFGIDYGGDDVACASGGNKLIERTSVDTQNGLTEIFDKRQLVEVGHELPYGCRLRSLVGVAVDKLEQGLEHSRGCSAGRHELINIAPLREVTLPALDSGTLAVAAEYRYTVARSSGPDYGHIWKSCCEALHLRLGLRNGDAFAAQEF